MIIIFFFFNDTATTEIYTLSLHDALPISGRGAHRPHQGRLELTVSDEGPGLAPDRKSTRLNSSHLVISYAVFCLKKKKKTYVTTFTDSLHRHADPSRSRSPAIELPNPNAD